MAEQTVQQQSRQQAPARRWRADVVSVNGIRMRYLDWPGPAQPRGLPVVVLHGLLQSGEGMANLAGHLARRSRVIAPDLRGRGETEQPESGYDPETMADDVAALIEHLGLGRVALIGRMHGGVVAYHLASRRPDLIGGLVIGDTPPEVDAARTEWALNLIRQLPPRFAHFEAALAYYQGVLGLSQARAEHDIPSDLIRDEDGSYRWRHNLALVERIEAAAMPRADWPVLEGIEAPTLVLRGQRGEIALETAERICETISQARCRVQTVIGAHHDVFIGPGCEQSFGAIDLFLMGLANGAAANGQAPLGGAERGAAAAAGAAGETAVERIVRAINSRDPNVITALFAPDAHIVQYGEGGKLRDGGLDAVHAAFSQIFAGATETTMEVRDLVTTSDRVACVFAVQKAGPEGPATTIFAPAFFRIRDGKVAEFTSYHVHVPAGEA